MLPEDPRFSRDSSLIRAHNSPMSLAAPLHLWEWPEQPWRRVHSDYAGPYLGHMFLKLIDAHSKWMEVHITKSSTSLVTIEKMRSTFATLGLPEQLVTDNGPSFTIWEFRQFMRNNGVHHITTSPYHQSSNGLAERAVQTFKSGVKKVDSVSIPLSDHTPCQNRSVPSRADARTTAQDTSGPAQARHWQKGKSTPGAAEESTMLIQNQESSSLGCRSTPRTLVKGLHGYLGSSKI